VEPLGYKAFLSPLTAKPARYIKKKRWTNFTTDTPRLFYWNNNDSALLKDSILTRSAKRKSVKISSIRRMPQIIIVTEKLLTVSMRRILYAMYLDKPMR